MTTLYRIRALWTGFSGAPGYTNLYFGSTDPLAAGAQTAANDVRTFFDALKINLPSTVTITVDPTVALVDDFSGQIQQELQLTTPPAAVVGSQATAYAAPSGACITWNTGQYRDGQKVRGRTYCVPYAASTTAVGGGLSSSVVASTLAAANGLINGASILCVYSRPRAAKEPARIDGKDRVLHRDGVSFPVTSTNVRNYVAVLTSRRY